MSPVADAPRAALVRPPSDAFARAISSTGAAIDPDRARAQHAAYRDALADLVEVVVLAPEEDLPDACFVDDCAVVLGGQALLTRPGAPSRAGEPVTLAGALAALVDDAVVGTAELLEQPALRGVPTKLVVPPEEAAAGNVLAVGTTVLVPAGCPRTAAAVAALGFEVRQVDLGEFAKADGGATCLSLLV